MKNLNTPGRDGMQTAEYISFKEKKRNRAAWQRGLGSVLKGWLVFWLLAVIAFMASGANFG